MNESTFPTIISFYTDSWKYPQHATRLINECNALRLDHRIEERTGTGSWMGNCRLKPEYIYESLTVLKRPILWLDVDASILCSPTELTLPIEYDFMGVHQRTGPRRTWHVGTMFFNYNEKTVAFLKQWVDLTIRSTDESSFETCWTTHAKEYDITSKELPLTYYSIPEVHYNGSIRDVISHRLSKCDTKKKKAI